MDEWGGGCAQRRVSLGFRDSSGLELKLRANGNAGQDWYVTLAELRRVANENCLWAAAPLECQLDGIEIQPASAYNGSMGVAGSHLYLCDMRIKEDGVKKLDNLNSKA